MLGKAKPFPVIIVAPSGAGKSTICENIISRLAGIKYSISVTTRKPREGEVNGKDYFFISKSDFHKWVEENKFCEWAEVYGELYGTPKDTINQYLSEGYNVLLDIDIQGAKNIKLIYSDAISIFILPPSIKELETRLVNRNQDSSDEINKRLEFAQIEISHLKEFDYGVANENINVATEKIMSIIIAEGCKTERL